MEEAGMERESLLYPRFNICNENMLEMVEYLLLNCYRLESNFEVCITAPSMMGFHH
jgi:hypothetical protein